MTPEDMEEYEHNRRCETPPHTPEDNTMTREQALANMPGIEHEHSAYVCARNFVEVRVNLGDGTSEPIATFHERNQFGGRDGTLARAHLFAAAPDMLAALRQLVDTVMANNHYGHDAWPPTHDKAMFDAMAAISRATREG